MNNKTEQDSTFELWLEFELWTDGVKNPYDDFFNMTITLGNGSKYALNVWTYKYLTTAKAEARHNGEHVGGIYMPAPDVFVEKLDRNLLEVMVNDMIENNQLNEEWLVSEEQI